MGGNCDFTSRVPSDFNDFASAQQPINSHMPHTVNSLHLGFAKDFRAVRLEVTKCIARCLRCDYDAMGHPTKILKLMTSYLDAMQVTHSLILQWGLGKLRNFL